MTNHELTGLEANNLLAFLALLGLLRALETSQPDWRPRASWKGVPWRPQLHVEAETDKKAICEACTDGLAQIAAAYDFAGRKNIDYSPQEFREAAENIALQSKPDDRLSADLMAALGSEAATRRNEDRVEATALCAIHGQGHQNFLERLANLGKPKEEPDWAADKIAEALFSPWSYIDLGLTFRWDPKEDRRYALGFANPSGEKIRTVWGANRLAVAGFPTFTTAPMGKRIRTTAFRREGRETALSWPIWTPPLSRSVIQVLLNHPSLLNDTAVEELSPYGVVEVMRARRVSTGKYLSFEPARPLRGTVPASASSAA